MRIGVIHWAFPPVIGGVETHLLTILPEMVKKGAEVFILTSVVEGQSSRENIQGVEIIREEGMLLKNLANWKSEGRDLKSYAESMFAKFIEDNGLEAIKAHNLHLGFSAYSASLLSVCRKKGIPAYLVLHNDFLEWKLNPEYSEKEKEMWKILDLDWDCIVSISEYIKRSMFERKPAIKDKRWEVILHGIDLEKFHPVSPDEREKLKKEYGFSGRELVFHPARMGGGGDGKGIVSTIKVMPAVVREFPKVKLVLSGGKSKLVGEEITVPKLSYEEELIKELNIEDNVHIGQYSFADIPNLYNIADVLVAPTQGEESFGLCPVEAMASQTPAVVTNSGGLIESVVDGVTGFIIEKSKTLEQLPLKIIELLKDEDLRGRMGRAGRKRAEDIFDKKRMAIEFIELAEDLVKRKRKR